MFDAPRQEARVLRPAGRIRIRRVARGPLGTLTSRVDDKMSKSHRRPGEPFERVPAAPPVAEVFDHAWTGCLLRPGGDEPCLDRVAAEARERDVEGVDGREARVERLESRVESRGAGLGEGPAPEGVEVSRLVPFRPVEAKVVEGEVELGHRTSGSPALVGDVLGDAPRVGHDGQGRVGAGRRRE